MECNNLQSEEYRKLCNTLALDIPLEQILGRPFTGNKETDKLVLQKIRIIVKCLGPG